MEIEFNEQKFKELVLYIALRSDDDKRFGAVKLNKILFYSDFNAYRELGKPITGAAYQHLGEGPAPRELLPARKKMTDLNELKTEPRRYFGKVQKRLVALRPPDLSIFTTDEIRIVDEIITTFWEYSGAELSERTHREYGWRLTDESETIPYTAAFFSEEPLSQDQIERGQQVAAKYELQA